MSKLYDVIIAGAGPVGLFLACELSLAKASVLVLECEVTPNSPWRVGPLGRRGLNMQALDCLQRRGLLHAVFAQEERPNFKQTPGFQFGGHFAGIALNANKLDLNQWKYRLAGPTLLPGGTSISKIDEVLTDRAQSLGVTILRGRGVAKISTQERDTVTVETDGNDSYSGRWLVGCDGGRSIVRKHAGIDFAGTNAQFTGYAVQCDWDHPERLKPGFHHTKNGMYIIGGPNTVYLMDFDDGAFDRSQEIRLEHLQDIFERTSGVADVKITKLHLALSFTDRCKQAATYRRGRILLAGDAAHIHGPVGSQGMNLGLTDAMNLGWKLAAMVRQELSSKGGEMDFSLIDTYESERHPVGAEVLAHTRTHVATLKPDPHGAAVQDLIRKLIDTTDGTSLFIDRHWGLSQRYDLNDGSADEHSLVGCSVPDFELTDGSRFGPMLQKGRAAFVVLNKTTQLLESLLGDKYKNRVDTMKIDVKDACGLSALLIRPDGIVAWAVDACAEPNLNALEVALARWFAY